MKIEYIDNSATQYDHNASEIKIPNNSNNIKYKLYFGDYLSASFVQLKHRNIKFVVCGSRDLFMFSKEPNVNYLNIDPNDDTKDIPKTYEFIENALKEGNCLVHGESGGAAIVLYYILVKSNTSLATTLKILKRDRNFPNIRQNVVKYLLIKEKLQLGTNSVYLGGKGNIMIVNVIIIFLLLLKILQLLYI